jgi:hypothetical protein
MHFTLCIWFFVQITYHVTFEDSAKVTNQIVANKYEPLITLKDQSK